MGVSYFGPETKNTLIIMLGDSASMTAQEKRPLQERISSNPTSPTNQTYGFFPIQAVHAGVKWVLALKCLCNLVHIIYTNDSELIPPSAPQPHPPPYNSPQTPSYPEGHARRQSPKGAATQAAELRRSSASAAATGSAETLLGARRRLGGYRRGTTVARAKPPMQRP